ncbi:hypothetical protein [Kocuria sp. TGY1127_2]|uniref:hypothetical protein n=1 Tax=Kocuria sp. TGY1127_2 TaxID=2711328 RepID=UPI001A9AE945|nr:hypothetical protein [Kocuria sp. TGY1127_2]
MTSNCRCWPVDPLDGLASPDAEPSDGSGEEVFVSAGRLATLESLVAPVQPERIGTERETNSMPTPAVLYFDGATVPHP